MALKRGHGSAVTSLDDFLRKGRREGECLMWKGHILKSGYALTTCQGRRVGAHVAAFVWSRGRWPKKLVLHTCDRRSCINPEHLYEGTQARNLRDALERGRVGLVTFRGARAIRRDREKGMTQVALSKKYGFARRTIRSVLSGRSWKEVGHR